MRLAAVMWAVLVILSGVGIFVVKYQVQALEDELHAKEQQIDRDRSAIRVLEAEWAYLNDPGRLRRLSEEHLHFTAPTSQSVATIDQLPFRAGAAEQPVVPPADLWSQADAEVMPAADSVRAPASANRPGTFPVSFARLQRLLAPVWPGTIQLRLSQTTPEVRP